MTVPRIFILYNVKGRNDNSPFFIFVLNNMIMCAKMRCFGKNSVTLRLNKAIYGKTKLKHNLFREIWKEHGDGLARTTR